MSRMKDPVVRWVGLGKGRIDGEGGDNVKMGRTPDNGVDMLQCHHFPEASSPPAISRSLSSFPRSNDLHLIVIIPGGTVKIFMSRSTMTFVFPVTSATSSKQFRVSSGPPPAKKMKMTNSPRFEFNESPVRTFFPLHKPTPSALSKPDYKHTKNAMKNMSPSDLLRFVHTNPDYAMTAERIFKKICLNQMTNLDPALAASTWRQTYINLSEKMEH